MTSEHHSSKLGFTTRAVHYGQEPDALTGAVTVPIYQTSTFAQTSPGKTRGYEYSRTGNPTRGALEKSIASLENARFGLAFSSGMGAISCVGSMLKSGDSVLICDDVYGGTYRLFTQVLSKFSISTEFVDATNPAELERMMRSKHFTLLILESPTNPLMKVIDIRESCEIAHQRDTKVVVDNTFTSPYLQNPLDLGADLVVHSTTKYLGGHSDVVGGAIATSNEELYEQLKFLQNACGAVPGPFDCSLVLRGIKTLSLRMERHCENAMSVAVFLEEQKDRGRAKNVNYPGLDSSPFHALAKRQMRLYGGMLSFEFNSPDQAIAFLEKLHLFTIAESLGGVESLVELPARMTHASVPESERKRKGITGSLVRVSVGIEDNEDLIQDFAQAFSEVDSKSKAH